MKVDLEHFDETLCLALDVAISGFSFLTNAAMRRNLYVGTITPHMVY